MSANQKIKNEIVNRLKRGGKILIAAHISPDGDSIGSQLAIYDLCKALGCDPMIVNHDRAFPKYSFLSKCKFVSTFDKSAKYPRFDLAILLEIPELARLGEVQNILPRDCPVVNIDHHQGNTLHGELNFVDESYEACGIMILELFEAAGIKLSPDNADELYTAILTDTGRFRFANTTPRALQVAARLLEAGASPKKVSDALYACFTEKQLRMIGLLLSTMEVHHNGRCCFLVSDKAIRDQFQNDSDEIEGLADYTLYTCGVQVGALLRELGPARIKISLRSHDDFDVSAIAQIHGGGGHKNAAGCYINLPIREAKQLLLSQIERAFPA